MCAVWNCGTNSFTGATNQFKSWYYFLQQIVEMHWYFFLNHNILKIVNYHILKYCLCKEGYIIIFLNFKPKKDGRNMFSNLFNNNYLLIPMATILLSLVSKNDFTKFLIYYSINEWIKLNSLNVVCYYCFSTFQWLWHTNLSKKRFVAHSKAKMQLNWWKY